jgi:hypothetical protein
MEQKSGTKTTEFWVALAPVLIGLIEGQKGDAENSRYLIVCGTALGCIYIISRTLLKLKTQGAEQNVATDSNK